MLLIIILDGKTTAKMMADNFFVVMGPTHGYMLSSFYLYCGTSQWVVSSDSLGCQIAE